MSTLDKLLTRLTEGCEQRSADDWRVTLSNGHLLTVSAHRDEDFLLLDADSAVRATGKTLIALAEQSCAYPTPVKLALRRGSPCLRLGAEIPLAEDVALAEDRIGGVLDDLRRASHRLHNAIAGGAGEHADDRGPAVNVSLKELLHETAWQHHARPGGVVLVDLETGDQFLQAAIEPCGAGARFSVTLYRGDGANQAAHQALCLYLLEANASLRYARAFVRRHEEEISAGFELCFECLPSVAEVNHGLAALSVAGRQCAREIGVLMKDGPLAGAYRCATPLLD